MNLVSKLKKRLARVKINSWHYGLVEVTWSRTLQSGQVKACKYWWVMFPTSLLVGGLLTAIIFFAIVGGFFFGRLTDFKNEELRPYKKLKDGRAWPKFAPAPYQAVLPVLGVWGIYHLWNYDQRIIFSALLIIFTLMVGGGIGLLITKGLHSSLGKDVRNLTSTSVNSAWNKMCPVLEVVVPLELQEISQENVALTKSISSKPRDKGRGRKI